MSLATSAGVRSAIAIAALGAVALIAPSAPSEAILPGAKICKSWISGTGNGPTHLVARHKARADWVAKATAEHGAAYASLANAMVGAFVCNHAQGKSFCTIRAKPCTTVPKQLPIKSR